MAFTVQTPKHQCVANTRTFEIHTFHIFLQSAGNPKNKKHTHTNKSLKFTTEIPLKKHQNTTKQNNTEKSPPTFPFDVFHTRPVRQPDRCQVLGGAGRSFSSPRRFGLFPQPKRSAVWFWGMEGLLVWFVCFLFVCVLFGWFSLPPLLVVVHFVACTFHHLGGHCRRAWH